MNEHGHNTRFYLADWLVDPTSNRLSRGDTEIKLESRVMALLNFFAQHKGELVTREDLEQAIWGRTIVGYDALTTCIAKLRKALCDDTRQPQYIETISKKGYRLIAPVSSDDRIPQTTALQEPYKEAGRKPDTRIPPAWPYWILVLVILALPVTFLYRYQGVASKTDAVIAARHLKRPSIVVLPFRNLGGDPGQNYFSDGVTADITTALSKLSGLFVISQFSASGYRDSLNSIQHTANSLGVRYVLEGSIRRTGNRLRVNVNLIDTSNDIYLWSEKYDRELHNVFEVQDDITRHIVSALSIKLTEEEKRRTARKYTHSIAAYDDFLRGQSLYMHHSREDNNLARQYYQRAIDRDTTFSRAYSAMALTHVAEQRYGWNKPFSRQLEKALYLARKGLTLDPNLPQAHWALGYVHLFRQEYQKAYKAANRAVELDSNYADSYLILAICRLHEGVPDDAILLIRKAMLLNPEYPTAYASILGQAYFFQGDYEQAITVLKKAADRNINLLTAQVFLIAALSKVDRMDEARWTAEELKTVAPGFTINRMAEMLPIQEEQIIKDMQQHLHRAGL